MKTFSCYFTNKRRNLFFTLRIVGGIARLLPSPSENKSAKKCLHIYGTNEAYGTCRKRRSSNMQIPSELRVLSKTTPSSSPFPFILGRRSLVKKRYILLLFRRHMGCSPPVWVVELYLYVFISVFAGHLFELLRLIRFCSYVSLFCFPTSLSR